ncbi:uncharacterized protein LOC120446689 [Drosophila santomea]|uniref:uncharacterized protein LOC120446689 n=1 Tax=Drosophila santomea TaxID=129105 RepID=UPI00195479EC|nr:uncharacterized protein LOC120446689 [Drosophila santomea]
MFLAKSSAVFRPQLFNEAKALVKSQFQAFSQIERRFAHSDDRCANKKSRKCEQNPPKGVGLPPGRRHSHSDGGNDKCAKKRKEEKKCEKFVSQNAKKPECKPPLVQKPKYYRQLNPCKTDKELSELHPKYLGVWGRCDIPYKPEPECLDPCDLAERLDDKYYKPSKSLDRKFDQYWVECFFRKQKRCCRKVAPERTYRVIRNKCAAAPKKTNCFTVNPMPCKQEAKVGPCPKLQLCECPTATAEINCKLVRRHTRCRRRACQYPSFSECQHEELNTSRPIECRCLEVPPTCLVYRHALLDRRLPCEPLKPRDSC